MIFKTRKRYASARVPKSVIAEGTPAMTVVGNDILLTLISKDNKRFYEVVLTPEDLRRLTTEAEVTRLIDRES